MKLLIDGHFSSSAWVSAPCRALLWKGPVTVFISYYILCIMNFQLCNIKYIVIWGPGFFKERCPGRGLSSGTEGGLEGGALLWALGPMTAAVEAPIVPDEEIIGINEEGDGEASLFGFQMSRGACRVRARQSNMAPSPGLWPVGPDLVVVKTWSGSGFESY